MLKTWIALLFLSCSAYPAINTITADTLNKMLTYGPSQNFLLIDVREVSELTSGVIATQNCRPYNLPWNSHVLDSNMSKLPKNVMMILYCQSGVRSSAATQHLDSNGFTMVYSLVGGFNGWTGSKELSSYVKSTADLPAPSMLATSVLQTPGKYNQNTELLSERNGYLFLNKPLTELHTLYFYTMQGSCILQKYDPFYSQASFKIPAEVGNGTYILSLDIRGKKNSQTIKIMRH
jgi:rhodanese-related sulfurtransferase